MRRVFGPETLALLPATGARRLLLASPAPASLARDLRTLLDRGWHLRTIQPIDQLPGTHHLMAVAFLEVVRG